MKYISYIRLHISREKFSNGNATLCRSQLVERWRASGKRSVASCWWVHPQLWLPGINFSQLYLVNIYGFNGWFLSFSGWQNINLYQHTIHIVPGSAVTSIGKTYAIEINFMKENNRPFWFVARKTFASTERPNTNTVVSLLACSTFCLSRPGLGLCFQSWLAALPSRAEGKQTHFHISYGTMRWDGYCSRLAPVTIRGFQSFGCLTARNRTKECIENKMKLFLTLLHTFSF